MKPTTTEKQRTNDEIIEDIKYLKVNYSIPTETFGKMLGIRATNIRDYLKGTKKFGTKVNLKLNTALNQFSFLLED